MALQILFYLPLRHIKLFRNHHFKVVYYETNALSKRIILQALSIVNCEPVIVLPRISDSMS